MKLVDLDQTIFVPVVDETHGGAVVEMKMTVGEFFEKCCQGFEPEVVEAIPVQWLQKYTAVGVTPHGDRLTEGKERLIIHRILNEWQKEQEG